MTKTSEQIANEVLMKLADKVPRSPAASVRMSQGQGDLGLREVKGKPIKQPLITPTSNPEHLKRMSELAKPVTPAAAAEVAAGKGMFSRAGAWMGRNPKAALGIGAGTALAGLGLGHVLTSNNSQQQRPY